MLKCNTERERERKKTESSWKFIWSLLFYTIWDNLSYQQECTWSIWRNFWKSVSLENFRYWKIFLWVLRLTCKVICKIKRSKSVSLYFFVDTVIISITFRKELTSVRFCNLNCSSSVVFKKHWLEISQTSGIGFAHWCFLFRYKVCLAPDFELLFNSSFSDGYAIFTSNFDYHIFSYFQGHLISPKSWKTWTGDFHFAICQKGNDSLVFSPPKKSNFWFLTAES